jgi:hypothetical protein
MQKLRIPTVSTAASALILAMQGLTTIMAAFLVLATRPYSRVPFVDAALSGTRTELALALVLFAFVLFLVAFAVAALEGWGRIVALAAEVAMLAGALYRFPEHPAWSLAGAAVAAVAIGLLVTDRAWEGEDEAAAGGGGEAVGATQ